MRTFFHFSFLKCGNFRCEGVSGPSDIFEVDLGPNQSFEFLETIIHKIENQSIIQFSSNDIVVNGITVSKSPGVLRHSQIAYPGMQSMEDSAVNQPNKWAMNG